ncbi:MAG: hypothetical protein Q4E92_04340 [Jeotgalicoccus sp.]|nr:hypothetical protein [Jeotgalicoccus sp.]
MTNYKKEYEKVFSGLPEDDQLAFNSLNTEFDKHFVTEDAKYEKLYIMADVMVRSGKDYVTYYNAKTKDVARVASKDLPKYRNKYWSDAAILGVYFAVLFSASIFLFGEVVISLVLPGILVLILAMVPLMNHGIKHQSSARGNKQMVSGVLFLILFVGANLLILFMNSETLSPLKITSYDASLVDTLLFVVFVVVAAASVYFIFSSKSWASKLIFIVLFIYSAGRLIYPFDFLNELSEFIVQYFMFIGLIIIIIAQYLRAKSSNKNES